MEKKNMLSRIVPNAVVCLAVFAIAFVMRPDNADETGFWYRVIWTEILCVLAFWGGSLLYSVKKTVAPIGASVSIIICSICALSFIAMLAQYALQSVEIVSKLHICFQIIIFVGGFLLIRGLFVAKQLGTEGMVVPKEAAVAPRDIAIKVKSVEKILSDSYSGEFNSLINQLKIFRERVEYSLQDNTSVRMNDDYKNMYEKTVRLCSELFEHINEKEYLSSPEISQRIVVLISQVDSISMQVRK